MGPCRRPLRPKERSTAVRAAQGSPAPVQAGQSAQGQSLGPVQLLATTWTVARQASPPMGFSRQELLERVATSSSKPSPRTPRQLHSPAQESISSLLKVPAGGGLGKNLLPGLQADRSCSCFSFQYVFVVTKRWQKTGDRISLLPPHESGCRKAGSTSHFYPPSPRPAPEPAHSSALRQPSEWTNTAGLCS